MKKLLVCLSVAALTTITSLQAGESAKDKSTCSTEAKSACSAEMKSSCGAQTASSSKSCCSAGKVAKKKVDTSVKGATLLVRR